MTLVGSLNSALSALNAQMIALQTTSNNIANATTPGYSRQRVDLQTAKPHDFQFFQVGAGVEMKRISRSIDLALEGRLRDAASQLNGSQVSSETLQKVETVMNSLSDSDIGALLSKFFEALQDLSLKPDDIATRTQVIENAKALSFEFNNIAGSLRDARTQLNDELKIAIDETNDITKQIADLNAQIASAEKAGLAPGQANDLRDRRDLLLRQLAGSAKITVIEDAQGNANVLVGSSYVVLGNRNFELSTVDETDNGVLISTPQFSSGTGSFKPLEGKIKAIMDLRDVTLKDIGRNIDLVAHSLIESFNNIHANGMGLERLAQSTSVGLNSSTNPIAIKGLATSLSTSDTIIDSSLVNYTGNILGRRVMILTGNNALEERQIVAFEPSTGTITLDSDLPRQLAVGDRFQISDLKTEVNNGSFKFVMRNELTGIQSSFTANINMDKIEPPAGTADTTLANLAAQIDLFVPGVIDAVITPDGKLQITSNDPNVRFSFAEDTSGVVGALGLNNFFKGSRAVDIGVEANIASHPERFAAGKTATPFDNSNLMEMVGIRSKKVVQGAATLESFYQRAAGQVAVLTKSAKDDFDHKSILGKQLEAERERVSGVNLDEEATKLIIHQRSFQAAARMVAAVDEVLRILMTQI